MIKFQVGREGGRNGDTRDVRIREPETGRSKNSSGVRQRASEWAAVEVGD